MDAWTFVDFRTRLSGSPADGRFGRRCVRRLALAIILPDQVLQDVFARLRRAGPLEFDPVKEPSVKEALDSVAQEGRAKAEEAARQVGNRLGQAMETWWKFANAVRAELAALGVRVTAIEEEVISVRDRVGNLEEACRSRDER